MTNILQLPQLQAAFKIVNNADWLDVIPITGPDGVTPIDLTGIDFLATVRPTVDSSVVLFSMSTVNNTLINGGVAGTIQFNVPTIILLGISAQSAVFDIVATDESGVRVNLFDQSGPAALEITQGCTVDLSDAIISYLEWIMPSLPTLPPQDGGLWINGGVLCVAGLSKTLPIYPPTPTGQLWANNGVLMVTGPASQFPTYKPTAPGYLWNFNGVVHVS